LPIADCLLPEDASILLYGHAATEDCCFASYIWPDKRRALQVLVTL
jgi:hypothetical protein